MTFEDFGARVDSLLRPYGVQEEAEHGTHASRTWKTPKGESAAIITYDPSDLHYPVKLGFSVLHEGGTWRAVGLGVPQMPLPLGLNDYGAQTAALETLKYFGIDNDLTITESQD